MDEIEVETTLKGGKATDWQGGVKSEHIHVRWIYPNPNPNPNPILISEVMRGKKTEDYIHIYCELVAMPLFVH